MDILCSFILSHIHMYVNLKLDPWTSWVKNDRFVDLKLNMLNCANKEFMPLVYLDQTSEEITLHIIVIT